MTLLTGGFDLPHRGATPMHSFFVDRMEQQVYASSGLLLSATRLLHHMGHIFRDSVPPVPVPDGMQIDRKRLQKLREKKIALGHKPDDHEEEQSTAV